MTIFDAGNELDVFNPLTSGCIEVTTPAAAFDSQFSRCAIQCAPSGLGATLGFSTRNYGSIPAMWISWREFTNIGGTIGGNNVHFRLVNTVNQDLIRIITVAGGTARLEIWNGGTFNSLGIFTPNYTGAVIRYDLFVDFPGNSFSFTANGVTLLSGALGIGSGYRIDRVIWNNLANTVNTGSKLVSEIIIADEDTRTMRVMTAPAIANGAETQWNGPVTNINEIALNDLNGIDTALINQLRSFTITTPVIPANFGVRAVGVGVRGNSSAGTPDDVQALIRIASINYFSASVSLVGALASRSIIFDVNPASGLGWSGSDLNASNFQFGLASR